MTPQVERDLRQSMLKVDRSKVELAYQRAMDIRDSNKSAITDAEEERYTAAYKKAYRTGDFFKFRRHTRLYLKNLRANQ